MRLRFSKTFGRRSSEAVDGAVFPATAGWGELHWRSLPLVRLEIPESRPCQRYVFRSKHSWNRLSGIFH